jgi:hypothetical protein
MASLTGTYDSFDSNVGTALAAQPVSVYISTAGTAGTINVLTQGAPNLDFTMAPGGSCAVGTDYPLGVICTVDVIFNPKYPGARLGAIVLEDASNNILGTALLPGTGYGPQAVFNPGKKQAGILAPINTYGATGVAVDGGGNVYFTTSNSNGVYETPWNGASYGTPVALGSGWSEPVGVAVDGAGNVFVGDYANERLVEIPWTGTAYGTQVVVPTTGITIQPKQVAVDGFGNVYFANYAGSTVVEMPRTATGFGAPVTLSFTGLNSPNGVAVVGTPVTVATGLPRPVGLAIDAAGDIYIATQEAGFVSNPLNWSVLEMTLQGSTYGSPLSLFTSLGAPQDVAIDGIGNLYEADFSLEQVNKLDRADSPSLSFASTNVGSTSSNSPQTVTVWNIGNAGLYFSASLSNPVYPVNFPVNSSDNNLCSEDDTVDVGASCDVSVNFTPTASGSLSGAVVLTDNNLEISGATQSIQVSGTATGAPAPVATLTPSLAFPSTAATTTSSALTATLSNTGNATLTITGITIAGANPSDFAVATGGNACGATLAEDASCFIYVTFTPASGASFSATLQVADNASGSPQTSALTGTGTAPPPPTASLSPNPYVFAATTVQQGLQSGQGGLSAITLTNNGTTPLSFTGAKPFTIIGPSNTPFTVYPNGGCTTTYLNFNLPLPAGASCTITVQFFPGTAGAFAATLSVADNAPNSPQTITVSGVGAAGQLQFFPAQFNIVAGNESSPGGNGPGEAGDGGLASAATLDGGYGVTSDESGNLYFSDYILNTVREINTSGDINVFAGVPGGAGSDTGDNGPAVSATLFHPEQIAFDPSGNLYIADRFNNAVREVNAAGTITTFYGPGCSQCGGSAGELSSPVGVASDSLGNLYVGNLNFSVFKISPSGTGTPFAGTGVEGYTGDNGPATQATLGQVRQVATDLNGNVYIADFTNGVVRKVNTNGIITTYAGGGTSAVTTTPQLATAVNLNAGPIALATDPNGDLYVVGGAGSGQAQVYFINTSQQISLIAGGGQTAGSGIPANAANINPGGIGIDAQGDLYVNDPYNHVIAENGPQGDLVFGSLAVGSTSAAMPLTLTNTGNAPVVFFNPNDEGVVTGRHRLTASALRAAAHGATPEGISGGVSAITGDFAIAPGGTCNIDASDGLSPGQSCILNVTFSPTASGARTGTITFYTELPFNSSISTVQLSGTGTQAAAPAVTLTPSLAFPSTTVGTTSSALVATLSNTGNAPLAVSQIAIAGANPTDFALTPGPNSCTTLLPAGASCSLYVTFTPASAASFSATLQLTDNAAGSPQTSALTGAGTSPPAPAVTFAPNPVVFAGQAIGVTSGITTVTLTNSGNATLSITGISITGTNPTDFAMTAGSTPCGSTLAAGASCNVNVTFTAPAAGSFSATLSVADNAAGSPQTDALSGSGLNPADFSVSVTPASQTVLPGASTTFAVTVSSVGGTFTNPVALTVSGLPAGATGTFSSPSVTPGSTGAPSTLTVQTSSSTQQTARNTAWPLAAPVLAAVGLFFVPGKRRRRWIALGVLLLASLGTLTALSGCGGGFRFVQTPQTYTLTVTGTSGEDAHSTTVQLTVE